MKQRETIDGATFDPQGAARIAITLDRGPHVSIAFTGDAIPDNERDRLVPARTEASVDEDLLEDSNRAIELFFQTRGYRDAMVTYARSENA
ncbi:MAG: POTRA domain-containing protein, partial [Bacteroidota bacterium]